MKRALMIKSLLMSFLCGSLIFSGCTAVERREDTISAAGWSSSDPLTIPYDIRQTQFDKGNLVTNPSFENGRRGPGETADDFRLDGWEAVGEHVRWARQEIGANARREAYSGSRAVKIVRRLSDDQGNRPEGVVSDFIPVIPGNYSFTYHIRLKDIVSHVSSLIRDGDTLQIGVGREHTAGGTHVAQIIGEPVHRLHVRTAQ